ncbi:MAG TPA: hypothetical protein VGO46_12690 [Gemmatimonadaceae bacterium]|nr:hypothetical protein [Gemmatimonadaceae bacterium]
MTIAACGGDGTTQPVGTLSADQVQSMTGALRRLLALSLFPEEAAVVPPAHLNARRMMSISTPIKGSRACPEGGHVGVDGSFSANDDGQIVFSLSDTLVECGIADDKSNVWIFTTKPTLETTVVETADGDSTEAPTLTISETDVGRLKYATGSLSGTCSMNATITSEFLLHTPTADSNTVSVHTTGTLCGRTLASDTSITTAAPPPSIGQAAKLR